MGDFIIDVLVGSAHPEVRTAASVLFSKLSHQSPAVTSPTEGDQTSQKRCELSYESLGLDITSYVEWLLGGRQVGLLGR